MTTSAPKDLEELKLPRFICDAIECLLLYSRYLLALSSITIVTVGVGDITIGFFKVVFESGLTEEQLLGKLMKWLHLLDVSMAVNLFWFIPAGGYYVFIHPKADGTSRFEKPRILAHISSGILKEKMVGSMVAIASVAILQNFLNVATQRTPVDIPLIGVEIALFLTLLACLLVFNHTNKADHHPHNDDKRQVDDH